LGFYVIHHLDVISSAWLDSKSYCKEVISENVDANGNNLAFNTYEPAFIGAPDVSDMA
jgi:hypothetical protein